MRLLKRDKDRVVTFTKDLPESQLPAYRYAILSHTWGKDEDEVTYEDILTGNGRSKAGYEKIEFCAKQTKRDELEYFWMDTCCINKSNNAELAKSLISMFRWYASAEKCYVFLSDVPQSESKQNTGRDWELDFRNSRWFKRGWTLQELIAPTVVEFFSKHGDSLGTKGSLEKEINEVTQIPVIALPGTALADFTVHERRQWQNGRETREPEDLVYSLLGLLDVSMPVLYGEGRAKAWRRLESEINIAQKGVRHEDFSLNFSLSGIVETTDFVARKQELEQMRKALKSDGSRRCVILSGLGGIGKTQLAIAYAMRHKDEYSSIFWLDATSDDSIKSSFLTVAKRILRKNPLLPGLMSLNLEKGVDEVVNEVISWLSRDMNTRWLLIFDNYDNPKVPGNTDPTAFELRRYIPEVYQGSVIVTTRSSEVRLGQCIPIDKLKLQDGITILGHSSGRGDLASGKEPGSIAYSTDSLPDSGAVRLAEKLDGLPLALATAGAYLSQNTVTFKEYLDFLEDSWAKLQKLSPSLMTYENRTLFSTWQISFDQIERRNSLAANLLRLWAYFDCQDLWFELLHECRDQNLPWLQTLAKDKLDFQACMRVLCDHGLANANTLNEYEVESAGYSIHPCVHSWIIAVLNAQNNWTLARIALICVALHIPEEDAKNWSLVHRRLLNHANRCAIYIRAGIGNESDLVGAYGSVAVLYDGQEKMVQAEELYLRAIRAREKARRAVYNSSHHLFVNLGDLYRRHERTAEAEELLLRALTGYKKVLLGFKKKLGLGHVSVRNAANYLAHLYREQGRMVEAKEMCLQVLRACEKVSGADHTSTLETIVTLGLIHLHQGSMAEAEVLFSRALKGYEKMLGVEHTLTLEIDLNLGMVYRNQGKLAEAEMKYLRVLRGLERALGDDHVSTIKVVNNLGNLYTQQGRLIEAEEMLLRALKGNEATLGASHTSTLTAAGNLGILYRKQGRLTDAEELHLRALKGLEKVLGLDHMSTINIISNLGCLYQDQGKMVEAEENFLQALRWKEKMLGLHHTLTLNTIHNLVMMFISQGRMEKAEQLYHRAQTSYDKMEPETQQSLDELGRYLMDQIKASRTLPESESLVVDMQDFVDTLSPAESKKRS